ncbi:DnaD domain protein [Metabacillus idriensis]|uniref:DnaD domain protein n=1 Tax=Metabacillus idriensis TaxID=324768 RepID=UPI00174A84A0|nr:DnaD domain protein [Metabacillus idriensis]
MSQDFFFPTYIGLLSPEHREKIGPALWEFLWFISKTTKEFQEGNESRGIVLGGRPVKIKEIAIELGASERTVKRNVARLKEENYIETKRTPYGEIYHVKKSKKFTKKRSAQNGTSKEREVPYMPREVPHMSKRSATYGTCNKDIKDIKGYKDDDSKNPFKDYENNFGFPTQIMIQEFNHWIDSSNFLEPKSIICEVISRTKERSPRNPSKYIMKILTELHQKELYTLEAVKEHNKTFDQKIGSHKKQNALDKNAVMRGLGIEDE